MPEFDIRSVQVSASERKLLAEKWKVIIGKDLKSEDATDPNDLDQNLIDQLQAEHGTS